MTTDDLQAEVRADQAARVLSPSLEEIVRRSPMIPEPATQRATLRWLRGQTQEERAIFADILLGVEFRADLDAEDDALVDQILAEEGR